MGFRSVASLEGSVRFGQQQDLHRNVTGRLGHDAQIPSFDDRANLDFTLTFGKRVALSVRYGIIERFGQITGTPVLLNTSFNLRGEPMVTSPRDAYNTFANSHIDTLVLNNFVVKKPE